MLSLTHRGMGWVGRHPPTQNPSQTQWDTEGNISRRLKLVWKSFPPSRARQDPGTGAPQLFFFQLACFYMRLYL